MLRIAHRHNPVFAPPPLTLNPTRRLSFRCNAKKKLRKLSPPRWGNERSRSTSYDSDFSSDEEDFQDDEKMLLNGSGEDNEFLNTVKFSFQDLVESVSYRYYLWRAETYGPFSDLATYAVISTMLFILAGHIQTFVMKLENGDLGDGSDSLWNDLYTVLLIVLGADLPSRAESGFATQAFAITVSAFGLASFAILLALIEQVVLEIIETNVKRGSAVYEKDHTVILAWCESARDLGQVTRLLEELCAANRAASKSTVAVLAQERDKLEMEGLYREAVPLEARYGSTFVFRQGSPLDPAALSAVAASDAKSIIISADYSRSCTESDAQVLRCAVLLDEMMTQKYGLPHDDEYRRSTRSHGPIVVAEVQGQDAADMVAYTCSSRVVAVPTTKMNVSRYCQLIQSPILAILSQMLTEHSSVAHGHVGCYPELSGCRFKDVHSYFDKAIILGTVASNGYGQHGDVWDDCMFNPPPDTVLQEYDQLIMLAPGYLGNTIKPMSKPAVELPDGAVLRPLSTTSSTSSIDQADYAYAISGICRSPDEQKSLTKRGQMSYLISPIYHRDEIGQRPLNVLILGWSGLNFMQQFLYELEQGEGALPPGSTITLVNNHDWEELLTSPHQEDCHLLQQIKQVKHIRCDPRSKIALRKAVDFNAEAFDAAVVLHDSQWEAPRTYSNQDSGEIGYRLSQADMLRLDSAVLMVQINVRQLLQECNKANTNIIVEKMTYIGVSRFENNSQLPAGNTVNNASYSARLLAEVASDNTSFTAITQLDRCTNNIVQDSSVFVDNGEELTFFQLQARVASAHQVLIGYYILPDAQSMTGRVAMDVTHQPLDPHSDFSMAISLNPQGMEARSKSIVWNDGSNRIKLVTLVSKERATRMSTNAKADPEKAIPSTSMA